MTEDRLIDSERRESDDDLVKLRPQTLDDFTGQKKVCENLKISIKAALLRGDVLDHVLFSGPPGLGKTTLAQIVSHELNVGFRATSAPMISKAGDLAAILTNLEKNDVLFIDEIHRLNPAIEEVLYSAMEDFQLDLIIGEGPAARSVRIDLPPFTLVGATTRTGLLTKPLIDRFGIQAKLDFYEPNDLQKIIERGAKVLEIKISSEGSFEIAKRSRGTPRIAGRLLKRVRDFALYSGVDEIDKLVADEALSQLDIDNAGLDAIDQRYLNCISKSYNGGPVGVSTLAAALGEEKDTIEYVVEPYLLQKGFIQRTPQGRKLTNLAYSHLNLLENKKEKTLFDE
ncbi:MAG: Holliday junction branch migration DNA helicase RuvB [Alphaproteobacteria bacterium]|nr:Holliday junction branch migration DNA helicase RuvB [Alphaproteobacteria bacterium]